MRLQYIGTCRKARCSVWSAALYTTARGAVGVPVACYILAKSEAFSVAHAARKQTENWALQKGMVGSHWDGEGSVLCDFFIFTRTTSCWMTIHVSDDTLIMTLKFM